MRILWNSDVNQASIQRVTTQTEQYSVRLPANMAAEHITDQQLVQACQAGSLDAFRELVSRYKNYVYSILVRQIGDSATAEELAQDVFLKVHKGLANFRSEATFKTWLTRITLNTANSFFRSKKFKKAKATLSLEEATFDCEVSDLDPVHRKQVLSLFRACLAKLSAEMCEVLTLCALQEQSYEQVADILFIPVGTVRSRLNRARLATRDCMQKGGIDL